MMPNSFQLKEFYNSADFEDLGFHDCYIKDIKLDPSNFSMVVKLDYIIEWVNPSQVTENFCFRICPAELVFENIDELEVNLRWKMINIDFCIENLSRLQSRLSPNGTKEWHWQFDLSRPVGTITLWATDFKLRMIGSPVLSQTQKIESSSSA